MEKKVKEERKVKGEKEKDKATCNNSKISKRDMLSARSFWALLYALLKEKKKVLSLDKWL